MWIWVAPRADYDSGWQAVGRGEAKLFRHNLGGNRGDYVVDLQFKDTDDGYGVNQLGHGGDTVFVAVAEYHSAYWTNLNGPEIKMHRSADDVAADRVRVSIWRTAGSGCRVFLPLIARR